METCHEFRGRECDVGIERRIQFEGPRLTPEVPKSEQAPFGLYRLEDVEEYEQTMLRTCTRENEGAQATVKSCWRTRFAIRTGPG